jgi:hypothetical protein
MNVCAMCDTNKHNCQQSAVRRLIPFCCVLVQILARRYCKYNIGLYSVESD